MEREGVTKHIVKNRSTLFCMIYYSIWPNQFPTTCGKCPILLYERFLYADKVCKNNNGFAFKGTLCLFVCTPDPQEVIGIIESVSFKAQNFMIFVKNSRGGREVNIINTVLKINLVKIG